MTASNSFHPNWASSPSSTIRDILKDRQLSPEHFAAQINRDIEFIKRLLHGELIIDDELALMLENSLGASVNFWKAREKKYRESIARLNSSEEEKWLKQIPIKELQKFGWIPIGTNPIQSFLNFFGVDSIWTWKSKYERLISETSFRTSYTFQSNFVSVASWLRKGEVDCLRRQYKKYDPLLFRSKLLEIKSLSKRKNPQAFIPDLINICASCGVGLSIIPTPKGCSASGATRFLDNGQPIILLSVRYLTDDHFWFTFFHEAGHILLHDRQEIFVEELGNEGLDSKEEKEANEFSSHILIPPDQKETLVNLRLTKEEIVRFAIKNDISSGIVIGQLQFSNRIGFHQLNNYKRRYNWTDIQQSQANL